MVRWFAVVLACGATLLTASGMAWAENPHSLECGQLVGIITATQKVEVNVEKSPIIGYLTMDQTTVAVTQETKITVGPIDLVKRGFGSLTKGCKVKIVFVDLLAKQRTAKEINIVEQPPMDK